MILEYMIGAATAGKACSQYFDAMINDTIKRCVHKPKGDGIIYMTFDCFRQYCHLLFMLYNESSKTYLKLYTFKY